MTWPQTLVLSSLLSLPPAASVPDAPTVRQTAREVLARPDYRLEAETDLSSIFEQIWAFISHILDAIHRWFVALWGMSAILAIAIVLALVVSACLLLAHIIWTLVTVIRRDRRTPDALDELSRRKVDPAELARQADDAGACGNYILGVRLLYRACLVRLEQAEEKPFRQGATNWEHLSRYRTTPVYDWLARLVSVIDLKWYGPEPCLASDFAECRHAYERICLLARGRAHAHHA